MTADGAKPRAPRGRALREAPVLLERDEQLDVLRAAVSRVGEGSGCLVVIEGAPGTGRSALLDAVRGMAADDDLLVLSAHGTPLESDVSHGLALQLLEPELRGAGRRDRGRLLAGDTSAIARAFEERRWPPETEPGGDAAVDELFMVVRSLALQRPLLITVDDAQWADDMSLRLLLYLAQRLEGLAAGVVVTVPARPRGGHGVLLEALARTRGARAIELAPLTDAGCAELVRQRLPDAGDDVLQRFTSATRGNPLLLTKLAEAARASGEPATEAGLKALVGSGPVGLLRAALMRLEHLTRPCIELARAVAVLGEPAALRTAAAVAGLGLPGASAALTALVLAGMLEDSEPLRFAQPLLGWIAYADIPVAIRARMHARAARLRADAGAPIGEIAAHAMLAWPAADRWVVERLHDAAAAALADAQPDRAVVLLRRALAEPPDADQCPRVLEALGEAEAAIGAPRAPERLLAAADMTPDGADRAGTRWRAGGLLAQRGQHAQAADVLEQAVGDLAAAGLMCPHPLTIDQLTTALFVPARARDAQRRTRLLGGAGDAGPAGELQRLARILAGEPVAAAGAPGPPTTPPDSAAGLSCLLWTDELAAVERACGAVIEAGADNAPASVPARVIRSSARLWRGELEAAASDALTALAHAPAHTSLAAAAAACAMHCRIERDDLAGAEALRARIDGEDELGTSALAAARLDLEQGRPARALARLLECGRVLEPVTVNPAVLAWRSLAASAASALGDRTRARELADAEVGLARRYGAPRPLGAALRAAGEAAAGERGVALLRESVRTLAASPAELELARSHVALGSALRAGGRSREAREVLRTGAELAEHLGALRLQCAARDELARAGARPRRRDATGPASFTPGEQRVAEFVARGLSNREIAADLVVTPKAVEWHLRHLYRKLDVVGRDQLVARLRREHQAAV